MTSCPRHNTAGAKQMKNQKGRKYCKIHREYGSLLCSDEEIAVEVDVSRGQHSDLVPLKWLHPLFFVQQRIPLFGSL